MPTVNTKLLHKEFSGEIHWTIPQKAFFPELEFGRNLHGNLCRNWPSVKIPGGQCWFFSKLSCWSVLEIFFRKSVWISFMVPSFIGDSTWNFENFTQKQKQWIAVRVPTTKSVFFFFNLEVFWFQETDKFLKQRMTVKMFQKTTTRRWNNTLFDSLKKIQ